MLKNKSLIIRSAPKTMRPLILITVIAVVAYGSPAPKLGGSTWDNLLQIGGDVDVKNNGIESGRSNVDNSLEDYIENYIKTHDVSVTLPIFGSTITLGGRNLDNDELNMKLTMRSDGEVQARKKSKIKKVIAPILIFILIKAMTLIPLALGILGIKTWNAIQLSFISFVSAVVMAVWKLCSKINDHPPPPAIYHEVHDAHSHVIHDAHPHIVHDHHDHHVIDHDHHVHHRSDNVAQQMAYNAYAPQQ